MHGSRKPIGLATRKRLLFRMGAGHDLHEPCAADARFHRAIGSDAHRGGIPLIGFLFVHGGGVYPSRYSKRLPRPEADLQCGVLYSHTENFPLAFGLLGAFACCVFGLTYLPQDEAAFDAR